MAIRTAIWIVGDEPILLVESALASEQLLEQMIVALPSLISDEWMLIGRQENTRCVGRIDLLAIATDGAPVLIELKRDRTPCDVVAQSLDYAGWVSERRPEDIVEIYERFVPRRNLPQDFIGNFGVQLNEETLNKTHQIIIVVASIDESTERTVNYLSAREVPINVLCFQILNHRSEHLLSRAWFLGPAVTQASVAIASDGIGEP